MKFKLYSFLLVFVLASFSQAVLAQTQPVIVKGYVTNTSGAAVANALVTIKADSSNAGAVPCNITKQKYTNANGYYIDTLLCANNAVITVVRITVTNCTGLPLTQLKSVPNTKIVEANFTVCAITQPTCVAHFTQQVTGKIANFLATSINTSADTLTQYTWSFGDGTTKVGKERAVSHTYTNNGTYMVCLAIKTPSNCIDSFCAAVIIRDTIVTPPCKAVFQYTNTTPLQAKFFSGGSLLTNDSIVNRIWNFGDGGAGLTGNTINPIKNYAQAGTYTVCLTIITAKGCTNTICLPVIVKDSIIPTPTCQAVFTFNNATPLQVKFNSSGSFAGSATTFGDSIVSRSWNFGDNTASLTGNRVDPTKNYTRAGTYTVCLTITTARGCSSTFCMPVVVKDTIIPPPLVCKAFFTYIPQGTTVRFNSSGSFAGSATTFGDSIVSRRWSFGDSSISTVLTGNVVDPLKQYARPGIYNVCLTITTARGCTSTYCTQVITTNVVSACIPQYFTQRVSGSKTVQFNSAASWVPTNDTIKRRVWSFGDGTSLAGNAVDPIKTYAQKGIYTVCLTINTAKGCTNTYCNVVNIQDTIVSPPNPTNGVKIVSLSPVPARTTLNAVIWSIGNNVSATIGVYDIYGVKKFGLIRNLLQGNNVYNINVSSLPNGPYFLRVTSTLGNDSKPFYKL